MVDKLYVIMSCKTMVFRQVPKSIDFFVLGNDSNSALTMFLKQDVFEFEIGLSLTKGSICFNKTWDTPNFTVYYATFISRLNRQVVIENLNFCKDTLVELFGSIPQEFYVDIDRELIYA